MSVITVELLAQALRHRIGYGPGEATTDAERVLSIFGFETRIIDNVLGPGERHLFYLLEEYGLLATDRSETTLYDGREWRTHYWLLNGGSIRRWAKRRMAAKKAVEEEVYEGLPAEAWPGREYQ